MSGKFLQFFLFLFFSVVQVTFVDAKEFVLPGEDPNHCVKNNLRPCAVSTGDEPRMFVWEKHRFELDRNFVLKTDYDGVWNVYQGMAVIDSKGENKIHTPFADIYLNHSKAMIHVLNNKVRVLSLDGQGVRVLGKGEKEEQFLVPGFQNWYGGVNNGKVDSGVASVIDFDQFAKDRAKFFLNHRLGFPNELKQVASRVKWAAAESAKMHQSLVERKLAHLEDQFQKKVRRNSQKVEFNRYLRRLFLQKIRYDY